MRALILLRHSLTEANERRLYCGWTDLALSHAGRKLAGKTAAERPLPVYDLCVTSGMRRANETLRLLAGRDPDAVIPDLREMHFGRFEMRGHWALKDDADYQRWIGDSMGPGEVRCPGGESRSEFRARVLRGGERLLAMEWQTAIAVTHGGPIVTLMDAWFPETGKNFYEWQPEPCGGYRVTFEGTRPTGYEVL